MKYNIFSFLLALLLFTACRKEEQPVFDKSPDERIAETLDNYQQQLVGAPYGWKAFVYPVGVEVDSSEIGGFTFYMKFTEAGRVTMLSDFDAETATVPRESSYRLKALQQPTLIFDTYSYIHTIADPNPNVSFGWYGRGWASDFELAFTSVEADTIVFTGRFNNSRIVFVKATEQEAASFLAGGLFDRVASTLDYIAANEFLYMEGAGNQKVGIAFDYDYLLVKFSYLDEEGNVITVNAPFSHTLQGIHFKYPVTINGITFQDLYWDDVKQSYYIQRSGTAGRIELQNATSPIIPLWKVIGVSYTSVVIPTTALPGQSPLFATKYNAIKTGVKTGGYNLDLGDITFAFNVSAGTMTLNAPMRQGTVTYAFTWNFTYTVDPSGIFKFTRTGQNGNAALVETSMKPLLGNIENDRFKLDFFISGNNTLGQFTSVENPGLFFTGNLK